MDGGSGLLGNFLVAGNQSVPDANDPIRVSSHDLFMRHDDDRISLDERSSNNAMISSPVLESRLPGRFIRQDDGRMGHERPGDGHRDDVGRRRVRSAYDGRGPPDPPVGEPQRLLLRSSNETPRKMSGSSTLWSALDLGRRLNV